MIIAVPEISGTEHRAPLQTLLCCQGREGDVSDICLVGNQSIPLGISCEKRAVGIGLAGYIAVGQLFDLVCECLHSRCMRIAGNGYGCEYKFNRITGIA